MTTPTEILQIRLEHILSRITTGLICCSDFSEDEFKRLWCETFDKFKDSSKSMKNEPKQITFDRKVTVTNLYNFLSEHRDSIVFFSPADALIMLKSAAFIRILEGAMCSSPHSGKRWKISVDFKTPFSFTGSVIISIPVGAVNWKLKKYFNLHRDVVIVNLAENARKINLLK